MASTTVPIWPLAQKVPYTVCAALKGGGEGWGGGMQSEFLLVEEAMKKNWIESHWDNKVFSSVLKIQHDPPLDLGWLCIHKEFYHFPGRKGKASSLTKVMWLWIAELWVKLWSAFFYKPMDFNRQTSLFLSCEASRRLRWSRGWCSMQGNILALEKEHTLIIKRPKIPLNGIKGKALTTKNYQQ